MSDAQSGATEREKLEKEASRERLIDEITGYLATGSVFNPEIMNGVALRSLLSECRAALADQEAKADPWDFPYNKRADARWHEAKVRPVAEVVPGQTGPNGFSVLRWAEGFTPVVGMKLYAAPVQSGAPATEREPFAASYAEFLVAWTRFREDWGMFMDASPAGAGAQSPDTPDVSKLGDEGAGEPSKPKVLGWVVLDKDGEPTDNNLYNEKPLLAIRGYNVDSPGLAPFDAVQVAALSNKGAGEKANPTEPVAWVVDANEGIPGARHCWIPAGDSGPFTTYAVVRAALSGEQASPNTGEQG